MKKIVLILLFLSSCRAEKCASINNELVNEFNDNLKIVEAFQQGKPIISDSYRHALLYLVNKTNIMTHADYSSTLGYKNRKDYKEDMALWKKWLEKNKCK
ncbi:hypothetical protein [Flavobacterium psychrotrophum]|uniref:hypothetical protein n=1 Tax=Flavobacterium psychrotrophum TaxID=2294119 RepID=UPI000E31E8F7|nr:hypothetical protein [Flavobacterium psychrotrophum]